MTHFRKHTIRVESWKDGVMSVEEMITDNLNVAGALWKRHHEHHSKHSDDFTIKIYNDCGELIDTSDDDTGSTYA